MKAQLIKQTKTRLNDGSIIEYKIWRLAQPKPGSRHRYAYRMAYIVDGMRVVGFDNERGKGDHCHLDGQEYPYPFNGLDTLLDDFLREVRKRR